MCWVPSEMTGCNSEASWVIHLTACLWRVPTCGWGWSSGCGWRKRVKKANEGKEQYPGIMGGGGGQAPGRPLDVEETA